MIKLKPIDPLVHQSHIKDLKVSQIVPLHQMPVMNYFPQYNPENVLIINPLLQLFAAFWVGNGFSDSYSLKLMLNRAPSLSLFLCDETILSLPSLFEKIFVLYSNSNTAIGFDIQGIKEDAYKALLKLKVENRLDSYLNDVFSFRVPQTINPSFSTKFFRVESEFKPEIPNCLFKHVLLQFLLKQCLIMGGCMIPIQGFLEDEIITKTWVFDLISLFENVIILTSNDSLWTTQGILVSKIREQILGLTSEVASDRFGSLGVIGNNANDY